MPDDLFDIMTRRFHGARLYAAIDQLGHTVQGFAHTIGISPATVYRAINEKRVSAHTRTAIIDGLQHHRA